MKALYLYKNRIFLRDRLSEEQKAKFDRGKAIGILAHKLFEGGIDVSPSSPSQYRKSLDATREAIQNGVNVIYEAAFIHKNTLIFLDILLRDGEGWKAYEVKSSRSITPTYVLDAALQYNVLLGSGLNIHDFSLIHVNANYRLNKELVVKEFFKIHSVLDEIVQMQNYVEEKREEAFETISLPASPKIDIGEHCSNPYPCEFQGHCRKHIPSTSVFQLSSFTASQQYEWYYQGKIKPSQIEPEDYFNDAQLRQLRSLRENVKMVDELLIEELSGQLNNPVFVYIFYLKPAVPFVEGSSPFQSIPLCVSYYDGEEYYHRLIEPENPFLVLYEYLAQLTQKHSLILYTTDELNETPDYISSSFPLMFQQPEKIGRGVRALKPLLDKGSICIPGLIPAPDETALITFFNDSNIRLSKARLETSIYVTLTSGKGPDVVREDIIDYNTRIISAIRSLFEMIFSA